MNIRFATKDDKEQVLQLLDELGNAVSTRPGPDPYDTKAQDVGEPIFYEIIDRDDTHVFVAEDNGQIVGLVTFYLLLNIRHGWHRGHIEDVIVSETARRQGVGTALMEAIKDYCRTNGIKVFKLTTQTDNARAQAFYEKNGGENTEMLYRFDID